LREEREKGFNLHFRADETTSTHNLPVPSSSEVGSNGRQRRYWKKHVTELKPSSSHAPSRQRGPRDGSDTTTVCGTSSGSYHNGIRDDKSTTDNIREAGIVSEEKHVKVGVDSDGSASYASDFESLDDEEVCSETGKKHGCCGEGSISGSSTSDISSSGISGRSGNKDHSGIASESINSEMLVLARQTLRSNNGGESRQLQGCATRSIGLTPLINGGDVEFLESAARIRKVSLALQSSNDQLENTRWFPGNVLVDGAGLTLSSAPRNPLIPIHEETLRRQSRALQPGDEPRSDHLFKPDLPYPLEMPPPPPAALAVPVPPLSSPSPLTPHSPPRRQAPNLPQHRDAPGRYSYPRAEAFELQSEMNGSPAARAEHEGVPGVKQGQRRTRSRWRVEEARASLAQRLWISNDDSMSGNDANSDSGDDSGDENCGTAKSGAQLDETEWALHSSTPLEVSPTAVCSDGESAISEGGDVIWEEDVEFNVGSLEASVINDL